MKIWNRWIALLSLLYPFLQCGFNESHETPKFKGSMSSVDSGAGIFFDNSIIVNSDGLPFISYQGIDHWELKVLKCGNADCTKKNIVTSVDSIGDQESNISNALGSDRFPIVVYFSYKNKTLKFLKCGGVNCSNNNSISVLDTLNNLGGVTSVTVGKDGLPVIAYSKFSLARDKAELFFLKCGNLSCSSGNQITTIDTGSDFNASLAIGSDGLPIISFHQIHANDLRVIKCGSADCSSGNHTVIIDSTHYAGSGGTSIAIGKDGFPIICFQEIANHSVKVIKCGSFDCSESNTIFTVVPSNVELPPHIGINIDGIPELEYQKVNTGEVVLIKCGNDKCSDNNYSTPIDTGYPYSMALPPDGNPIVSLIGMKDGALKVAKCGNTLCE